MRQYRRAIPVLLPCLVLALCARVVSADVPAGFPNDACTCVVEFDDAAELLEGLRSQHLLEPLLGFLGAEEAVRLIESPALDDESAIYAALLADGVIGTRRGDVDGEVDWVAWIGTRDATAGELLATLRPVRGLDRFVHPGLGIAISEVADGLLISPEPPGALRSLAIRRIRAGDPAPMCSARAAVDPNAPLVVTLRHEQPLGGCSSVALEMGEDSVEVAYRGRYEKATLRPPSCERTLDVEVLERMPGEAIAVIVEHCDAGILPGEDLISRLLPHVVEPEPSDERRYRRLVVLSDTVPEGADSDAARLPAVAVAIEVDGPGASVRRQDLAVLASLNTLRNEFGDNAGLQHLPALKDLPGEGTRTIYTRALFDPAFDGHPFARCVSANWCLTKGPKNWQLYATTPELAERVAVCLESAEGELACVSAAHAGRMHTERAVEQLQAWGMMAGGFLAGDRGDAFVDSVEVLTEMLEGVESLEWTIAVPDARSLDADVQFTTRQMDASK